MHEKPEVASGIARLEGYLLAQAETSAARTEAEAFARRMPWLTEAQHQELVRLYAEDRIALTRRMLQRVADRCGELRGEYSARYEQLRRRLVCVCLAVLLVASGLCTCVLLSAGAP
jgi:hypothetical protein